MSNRCQGDCEYAYENMPQSNHVRFQFVRSFMVVQSQKEPVVDLLLDYPKVLVVDITKRLFRFSEDTAKHLLGVMYDIMMRGSDEGIESEESDEEAVKKEEDIDKAVVKEEEH